MARVFTAGFDGGEAEGALSVVAPEAALEALKSLYTVVPDHRKADYLDEYTLLVQYIQASGGGGGFPVMGGFIQIRPTEEEQDSRVREEMDTGIVSDQSDDAEDEEDDEPAPPDIIPGYMADGARDTSYESNPLGSMQRRQGEGESPEVFNWQADEPRR